MLEMMITLFILLGIATIVMMAMMQMTMTQGMVANRTQMHGSVRSATELVQQEIGQSGRLPPFTTPVTLGAAVAPGTLVVASVNSVAGMFVNEKLVVDAGQMGAGLPPIYQNPETVTVTLIDAVSTPPTFTAAFNFSHNAGAPVVVAGAFPSGIIPTNATNPSTAFLLKMYGDINGDGNMVRRIQLRHDQRQSDAQRDAADHSSLTQKCSPSDFAEYHSKSWECELLRLSTENDRNRHLRHRRVRHADGANPERGSQDQAVTKGDEGALKRCAAERFRCLAAGGGRGDHTHSTDAGERCDLVPISCGDRRIHYEQNKRKRHCLNPYIDSGSSHISYGRLPYVPLAVGDLVQPELPFDVASARWSGGRSPFNGEFLDFHHHLYPRRDSQRPPQRV